MRMATFCDPIQVKKNPTQKKWTGGPEPTQTLPAKPGLNRYYWDLRVEPTPGIKNVFVFGSHNGTRVVPGSYQLTLRVGEETSQTEAVILPDPRIRAESGAYIDQAKMLEDIRKALTDIHNTVNQYRRVKSQVSGKLGLLRDEPTANSLVEKAEEILKELNAWEQQVIQPSQKTFQDVINFPNRLNAQFVYLGNQLDTNDPTTTQGCRDRLDDLLAQWKQQKTALEVIVSGPIKTFNSDYRANNFQPLIIPKKRKTGS